MNAGGDQGRDDYGLPPVDIEIPDDARELARDVQAYHRELRSRRRRLYSPVPHSPRSKSQNGWSTRAVSQSMMPVNRSPSASIWSS